MWTSIVTALIPFAIKILNSYFEKNKDKKDQREAYLKFLESMQSSASTPATMRNSYQDQIRRLREQENEIQ